MLPDTQQAENDADDEKYNADYSHGVI